MRRFGLTPPYKSKCRVTLYEATCGGTSWQASGIAGELLMKPLGGAVLHFQLTDSRDGQVLFEHTMQKPGAITIPVERFFVIRQENGSFHGLGFKDKDAANELKQSIQKCVKPFTIRCLPKPETTGSGLKVEQPSTNQVARPNFQKNPKSLSCESVPKHDACRSKSFQKEQPQQSSNETALFCSWPQNSPVSSWHKIRKGISAFPKLFVPKEHEMEIGYPTDVKHIAHIGWDGPTVSGSSLMDSLGPAPDFSLAPLKDFGQPQDPSWIHDAASAARWSSQDLQEGQCPPHPPPEYINADESKNGKAKFFPCQTKKSFKKQNK